MISTHTHFLICFNCRTIYEVPSRNLYIEKLNASVNKIVTNTGIKKTYKFWDQILPSCCDSPERVWAYGRFGFPIYSHNITRSDCISFINNSNYKFIIVEKEYSKLLIKALIATEI